MIFIIYANDFTLTQHLEKATRDIRSAVGDQWTTVKNTGGDVNRELGKYWSAAILIQKEEALQIE